MKFLFAGVEIGPFSGGQVARYLEEGFLSLSDLAKDESDTEWSSLQEMLERHPLPQSRTLRPVPKITSIGSLAAAARATDELPVYAA